jgi:DNA-binding transcriptional LysR family regulator
MELRQIRYFRAVAQEGHFRLAAERLGIAQPAISQQIRRLERELGVLLFQRTSRSVKLTAAGEMLLPSADRIVAEVDHALDELAGLRGSVRGPLRLGVLHTLGIEAFDLPSLLAEFTSQYPAAHVSIREDATESLIDLLLRGEINLAFVLLASASRPPAGVTVKPFLVRDMVVLAAASHPLARRERVALTDLRRERFIVFRLGALTRQLLLDEARELGFEPEIAFEVADMHMLRAVAAKQLGIAVVPRWCFKVQEPPLQIIELDPPRQTVTMALAWADRLPRPPAVTAFLRLVERGLLAPPPVAP